MLRAGFSQQSAAHRQVAQEIDGASAAHVKASRAFVSQLILEAQRKGLQQEKDKVRLHDSQDRPTQFWILNLMFDETELELTLNEDGPGAWSILASHAQLSVGFEGHAQDFDIIRLPQALPRKTAACMWSALNLEPGGLGAANLCLQAKFPCLLITCDQATANIKLLKHVHTILPQPVFLLPMLCAQHRNGNVVERITKLLGILPGSYCVAKCANKGKLLKDLKGAVRAELQDQLLVLDSEPPGIQAEWSVARRQAKRFLQLMMEGFSDNPGRSGGKDARINAFVDFFSGPWTGLVVGGACPFAVLCLKSPETVPPKSARVEVSPPSQNRAEVPHPLKQLLLNSFCLTAVCSFASFGPRAASLLTVCLAPLNCRAMSDRVPLDWADKELRSYMYREGLASLFAPCDARRSALHGLWPGPNMGERDARQALDELLRHLACDSYGGVAAVRYARDAYNARQGKLRLQGGLISL